jgi:hypothetical protein
LKNLLPIAFFSIFLFAQFGRVLSYAYCKWESRTELHCDCEEILVYSSHQDDAQLPTVNIPVKWEEPMMAEIKEVQQAEVNDQPNYPRISTSHTNKGFSTPPFHPPALV